jgi:hypothetical protein
MPLKSKSRVKSGRTGSGEFGFVSKDLQPIGHNWGSRHRYYFIWGGCPSALVFQTGAGSQATRYSNYGRGRCSNCYQHSSPSQPNSSNYTFGNPKPSDASCSSRGDNLYWGVCSNIWDGKGWSSTADGAWSRGKDQVPGDRIGGIHRQRGTAASG